MSAKSASHSVAQSKLSLDDVRDSYADVVDAKQLQQNALPVVYSPSYNITFFGLEKLHPFDPCKFQKVVKTLRQRNLITEAIEVKELPVEALSEVHTSAYLDKLHSSPAKVASVVELAPLAVFPMWLLHRLLLRKLRCHVSGTLVAAALAVQRGWAINVGGGMHHAHAADGDGWCPYSDITLAVRRVRRASKGAAQRVLVIDTDAHQGNGYARDKLTLEDKDLFILDLYNADIYPNDREARKAIDVAKQLHCHCRDKEYLQALRAGVAEAFERFRPDLVLHNAGTDILHQDPLGRMDVSPSGVVERDWHVWSTCRDAGVPVCMLLSGGYARQSASVVAESLSRILQSEAARESGRNPSQRFA